MQRAAVGLAVNFNEFIYSVQDDEINSNFAFNHSCFDRLFGTYREQPRGGQPGFTIGIHQYTKLV